MGFYLDKCLEGGAFYLAIRDAIQKAKQQVSDDIEGFYIAAGYFNNEFCVECSFKPRGQLIELCDNSDNCKDNNLAGIIDLKSNVIFSIGVFMINQDLVANFRKED